MLGVGVSEMPGDSLSHPRPAVRAAPGEHSRLGPPVGGRWLRMKMPGRILSLGYLMVASGETSATSWGCPLRLDPRP